MRREITLLIVLLVVLASLLYVSKVFRTYSEADARKFFIEDLASRYPTADAREILNVTQIGNGSDGYLRMVARVSLGLHTACPERIHMFYNYPQQNFVAEPPEYITRGCMVCTEQQKACVLAYPEEAIIASHKYSGGKRVVDYLAKYPAAKPYPQLLSDYNGQARVWQVHWDADGAPDSLDIYISQTDNRIIDSVSAQKQE